MSTTFPLVEPRVVPPLEPGFRPAVLANHAFVKAVRESGQGVPLRIALERASGLVTVFDTEVYSEGSPCFEQNMPYVERLVKVLLWARGGWKVTIGGPKAIGEFIKTTYGPGGAREFDYHFMGEDVYERTFTVEATSFEDAPAEHEASQAIGRHLDGCRIGLDLGGTDRKVSAVVEGEPVYSEEVIWYPKTETNADYHIAGIMDALNTAKSHMPKVDAIGVSSAGIYVDNRVMIASLFRKIPKDDFNARIKDVFITVSKDWGVPVEVANDGDVTALAGAMSLNTNGVLGVAMGTSEAGGFVNMQGNITGWLNELAFVPYDISPTAPVDTEWSGDAGCGTTTFCQVGVVRLCPAAGITPEGSDDGQRLAFVQGLLKQGDERAASIFATIGVEFGYALAHYADFYDVQEVLVLGRVTSGQGGDILLENAKKVLETEFPELAAKMNVQLPDEKAKRVGQSIAAASLPEIV
jgi:predicted NBD/HSP70 family sugar kinase